jgi:hypothetical protein
MPNPKKRADSEQDAVSPEAEAAIVRLVAAHDAWLRARLTAWRTTAQMIEEMDERGLLPAFAIAERRQMATLRRHALASRRTSDEEWEVILGWRDARKRILTGGHIILLSGLPSDKREECRRLMQPRLWTLSELRAWIASQKANRGRSVH